jgi:hypothetical protein
VYLVRKRCTLREKKSLVFSQSRNKTDCGNSG